MLDLLTLLELPLLKSTVRLSGVVDSSTGRSDHKQLQRSYGLGFHVQKQLPLPLHIMQIWNANAHPDGLQEV